MVLILIYCVDSFKIIYFKGNKVTMLNYKSKPNDIIDYIEQLKLLLLSEQEKERINQILSLDKLIKDDSIRDLIEEDLKDEKWIEDTKVLINTCCKKIEKSLIVQNHIDECLNFIVYRFLEEKANHVNIEVHKTIGAWNFNMVDKKDDKVKWVHQKFITAFNNSTIDILFEKIMNEQEERVLFITLPWLHANRNLFYSEKIFNDLNSQIRNINKNDMIFA